MYQSPEGCHFIFFWFGPILNALSRQMIWISAVESFWRLGVANISVFERVLGCRMSSSGAQEDEQGGDRYSIDAVPIYEYIYIYIYIYSAQPTRRPGRGPQGPGAQGPRGPTRAWPTRAHEGFHVLWFHVYAVFIDDRLLIAQSVARTRCTSWIIYYIYWVFRWDTDRTLTLRAQINQMTNKHRNIQ